MLSKRIAIRYAKAILDRANSKGVTKEVNNDMILIASTIKCNKELSDFIQNPTVKIELKLNILLDIFSTINIETKGLFRLLLQNKRFKILEHIALQFTILFDEEKNIEVAKVTTAFPITSDIEKKVLAKVKEFSNKSITIENIVDSGIIGGFILRIGDKQYNASIANRLQVLKKEFSN